MMRVSLESILIGYLTKHLIILESKIHGKLWIFELNGFFLLQFHQHFIHLMLAVIK